MAVDKRFMRQQILAQLDRCKALSYAAGQHFLQHGKHAPASMQAQAEADARLAHLIEDYAALGVPASDPPGYEGCNCAACELRRKHEAAAPGVPGTGEPWIVFPDGRSCTLAEIGAIKARLDAEDEYTSWFLNAPSGAEEAQA